MFKVAVPSRGDVVDEHFGHCERFTVFTVDDGSRVVDQMQLSPPPTCGCRSNLVETLADLGVQVMIAGNMGEGAVRLLGQHNIRTVRGASGPVKAAVQAWLDGKLQDNEVLCQSHGADGCGSH